MGGSSGWWSNLQRKRKLFSTSLTLQAGQYFDNSTLHGVRYIAEDSRPFFERFLWFCTTSVGLVAALVIIVSLWEKFQTNPTITGLDTDFHNWDVPFPAITVCQNDPSNRTLIAEYIAKTWPDAAEDKRAYYEEFLVALANISYDSLVNLEPFVNDASLPQNDLKKIVYEVVARCNVLIDCEWKGEPTDDCCNFFTPIFTENGFCFAFNLRFNETEWPYEYNRRPTFKKEYIQETDLTWSMVIDTDHPENNSVLVYIGSNDDLPTLDMAPHHVWSRRIMRLSFDAKETYTTSSARQLSIRQRRCVFEDEIALVTDTKYTWSACMRQCRMEMALAMCGCVPLFYQLPVRKVKGYKNNFRYCSLKELGCLAKNAEKFSTRLIDCPCELGCSNTVYEMEKLHEPPAESEGEALEIGFVSWPMQRYKREVLFGWVDLLVAFGGIAGLFLGFSLLSGVEIVYYFTLKAWCLVYRDKEGLERLAEEYDRTERPPVDLSLRPSFMDHKTDSRTPAGDDWDATANEVDAVGGLGYGKGRVFPQGTHAPMQGQRRRMSIKNNRNNHMNGNLKRNMALPYLP